MKKKMHVYCLTLFLLLLTLIQQNAIPACAETAVRFFQDYECGEWEGERCSVYNGELVNGKPNGEGTITYDAGGMYSGKVKDGHPCGIGTFTYSDGDKISGTFNWTAGDYYVLESSTTGDTPHYNGTELVYVGMTMDGVPVGFGILDFMEGGTFYGEFRNGTVDGSGVYVYREPDYNNDIYCIGGENWELVGRIPSDLGGRWYTGLVLDDQWQGYGMLCYDYSYYIGEVRDYLCDGHGVYWTWSKKGDPSGTLTQKDYGHYKNGKIEYTCDHKSKEAGSTNGIATQQTTPHTTAPVTPSQERTRCATCNGWGDCSHCKGTGNCQTCGGTGKKPCSSTWCVNGRCTKCISGRTVYGKICTYCHGDGICNTCFGQGSRQCTTCYGDGDCNFCYGDGDCRICGGDGYL